MNHPNTHGLPGPRPIPPTPISPNIRKFITVKKHLELLDSVENLTTGDRFRTEVTRLRSEDLKTITKKSGWTFDWKKETKNPEREVFKLTIENNSAIIQGLVSLSIEPDNVTLHQVESAPFNQGTKKVYAGVPGNLAAFATKVSYQQGNKGSITVTAKNISPEDKRTIKAFLHSDNPKTKPFQPAAATTRPKKKLPAKHPFSEAKLSPER